MQSMDTEEVAMLAEKMDEENRLLKIITVTREKNVGLFQMDYIGVCLRV